MARLGAHVAWGEMVMEKRGRRAEMEMAWALGRMERGY